MMKFYGFFAALGIGLSLLVVLRLTRGAHVSPQARVAPLWPILYMLLLVSTVGSFVLGFGHNSWVQVWTREDRLVEWTTFWLALLAAGCAGAAAWRSRLRSVDLLAIALAGLGIALAGEEIAWGQRWLGFRPPEVFVEHNAQRELSVHNLVIFGAYIGSWLQAVGPLLLLLGFFAWQLIFRAAADSYAGFRFHPHVAIFSLAFAAFFFLSSYPFTLRVGEDLPLARIPVEMFRCHASSQSELSELLFAAFLLLAALGLWWRPAASGWQACRLKHGQG